MNSTNTSALMLLSLIVLRFFLRLFLAGFIKMPDAIDYYNTSIIQGGPVLCQ